MKTLQICRTAVLAISVLMGMSACKKDEPEPTACYECIVTTVVNFHFPGVLTTVNQCGLTQQKMFELQNALTSTTNVAGVSTQSTASCKKK